MNKLVMIIAFVVVSAGMYFVCANAHIDFFPCEISKREFTAMGEGPLRTESGTCSLMAHNRPDIGGEKERLTGAGWAMLVGFCGGIGLVTGLVAGVLTKKKR